MEVRLQGMRKEVQVTADRLWIPLCYDQNLLDDRPWLSFRSGNDRLSMSSRHLLTVFPTCYHSLDSITLLGISRAPPFKMYRTPQHRPIQRQSVPEGMTTNLTERVSIISSAKVIPHDDITFKSTRLVGGYNWIESEDEEDRLTIAVPGTSIHLIHG